MSSFRDRRMLGFRDREFLENQVLPTARRWTLLYPPGSPMYSHGASTLRHWGEPLDLSEAPAYRNLRETVGEPGFDD